MRSLGLGCVVRNCSAIVAASAVLKLGHAALASAQMGGLDVGASDVCRFPIASENGAACASLELFTPALPFSIAGAGDASAMDDSVAARRVAELRMAEGGVS